MLYSSGLRGIRYIGYFNDDTNWFKNATLHGETNNLSQIDNFSSSNINYSWQWIGYFRAISDERYTFYIYSNSASYLWLNNFALNNYTIENSFVNNGGLHDIQEVAATTPSTLVSGEYYPIRIQFGENTNNSVISIAFSTASISKTTDGSGYYFYRDTALNTLNLSKIYLGSNIINKIYLGTNIVYENSNTPILP